MAKDRDLTVGRFFAFLGVHGFVFFLLILALLNVVIFMVPGFSIFFGVPMMILAVQMVLGLKAPIFPDFVCQRKIKAEALDEGLRIAARALEKIESAIKPRLLFLTETSWLNKTHSVLALFLSVMVAIPVPFLNLPPTFGVICLAIGLLQRDGLFILSAYGLSLWSFWLYESLSQAAGKLF